MDSLRTGTASAEATVEGSNGGDVPGPAGGKPDARRTLRNALKRERDEQNSFNEALIESIRSDPPPTAAAAEGKKKKKARKK